MEVIAAFENATRGGQIGNEKLYVSVYKASSKKILLSFAEVATAAFTASPTDATRSHS